MSQTKISGNLRFSAAFFYAIFQITQGLFFHPYQTMQTLARERVFSWLVFLPVAVWTLVRVTWGVAIVPLVRLVFSCTTASFWGCEMIPFFTRWLWYFCLLWQIVLLYLLVRFMYAFARTNR